MVLIVRHHDENGVSKMKAKMLWFGFIVVTLNLLYCLTERETKTMAQSIQEMRRNGILISKHIDVRSLGLNEEDMLSLVYGEEDIPGFKCEPPSPYAENHTVIYLDAYGAYSKILRWWVAIGEGDRRPKILIQCSVFSSERIAKRALEASPLESAPMFRRGSYSGLPLGEECLRNPPFNTLLFTVGRTFVIVQVPGSPEADGLFAEALAVGIECFIRLHPKRLAGALNPLTVLISDQPVTQGKAVSLAGVSIAPISALEPAQVSIKENRTSKEWTVTASRNGHWVKVKAFSWDMETERGKVKLERPVFPYKGELIVPLRQVAEALGIKVQQKGQTIALLPK